MTALEIITLIYPAFASTSNVSSYITMAEGLTSAAYFRDNYTLAVALRACHMYYVATYRAGQVGYITHESAGTLSRTYSGISGTPSNLESSSFGVQLLELINNGTIRGLTTSEYIQSIYLSE